MKNKEKNSFLYRLLRIITLFNVGTVLLCVMLVMKVQYDLLLLYLMLVLSYCA